MKQVSPHNFIHALLQLGYFANLYSASWNSVLSFLQPRWLHKTPPEKNSYVTSRKKATLNRMFQTSLVLLILNRKHSRNKRLLFSLSVTTTKIPTGIKLCESYEKVWRGVTEAVERLRKTVRWESTWWILVLWYNTAQADPTRSSNSQVSMFSCQLTFLYCLIIN